MKPSHAPAGVVLKVKRLPTTGSNPVGSIIQRAIMAPLVSARHICAGVNGRTSSTTMSCVSVWVAASVMLGFLQQGAEIGEALGPEDAIMVHPVEQGLEPLRLGAIIDPAPLGTLGHQPGLLQRFEMLRDGALRHP